MQQRLNGTYRNFKKSKKIIKCNSQPGAMVHAYYPNIWEVKTEVSAAQDTSNPFVKVNRTKAVLSEVHLQIV